MKRLIFESEDTKIEVFRNTKKRMCIIISGLNSDYLIHDYVHEFDDDEEFEEFLIEATNAAHE